MNKSNIEPRYIRGRRAMSEWSGFSQRKISELMASGDLPHSREGHRTVIFKVSVCAPIIDQLHGERASA